MVGTGPCDNINYVVFSTTLCLLTPHASHHATVCLIGQTLSAINNIKTALNKPQGTLKFRTNLEQSFT
jgi:hypothetical protein